MIDIVVLNRNLRLHDNAALYYGSLNSNYIVIHLYDENYWEANGRSARQLKFSYDCLQELDDNLKTIGSKINIFEGSFDDLKKWIKTNLNDYFIHINHCTDIDYFRKGFEKFKQDFGDRLKVYDDFGLQLTNFDRDTWSKNWNHIMHSNLIDAPKVNKNTAETNLINFNEHKNKIKSKFTYLEHIQIGGTSVAKELLESFLNERCENYRVKMSSPSLSENSCSRLSPHFTYGSISIRQVYQKLNDSLPKLENKKDLYSFKKRLYWHCHFVQKLHTEPELEFNSMHRMCDSLRTEHNKEILEKWIKGETGFPFLDACMKFLNKHGWINFRMRAMIMSFASYNMWQPWQKTSPLLAELFTDYEPGIHISQVQMQSGVTGINLPRIYSVPKQSMDQDPNSEWTKNILPQLNNFEPKFIHNAELNGAYIPQIVDLKSSAKFARDKIWGIRKSKEFKEEAKRVYLKHGSRRKRNAKTN
ncbi:deoxyribodipyrimidine photo-lyase [Gammaproteobacteria bacterium]|nr:deoxyribodipyrimidine photo-lyase [Gammaproteobacteria bacterium]